MPKQKTLAQIEKQIATLKRQADDIRQQEVAGVIARIKEAIAHYSLTAADLGLSLNAKPGRKPKAASKAHKAKSAGVVKYRDDAGHTWSGHGRRPQWFLDALASGKAEADLRA
jgi:DNA-binding protein H-NS